MKCAMLGRIGVFLLSASMAASAQQPAQPFSAVFWKTTTLHSPSGKSFIFTRRTVYTRDASGITRIETYQPTKGVVQDTTAQLEHVSNTSTSAQLPLPAAHASGETVQVTDLGASLFAGLPTSGLRQVFTGSGGQITHTLETWFCPGLGLMVHIAVTQANGDTINGDLSGLQLGVPTSLINGAPAVASAALPSIPTPVLYRSLFVLVDRMEHDRQANDPNRHVNMFEIEDHLRKRLQLSITQWQSLVATSMRTSSYTREKTAAVHSYVKQSHLIGKAHSPGNTLSSDVSATLHAMRADLNAHVLREIDELKQEIGSGAAEHIESYLHGPFAASTRVVNIAPTHFRAVPSVKETQR